MLLERNETMSLHAHDLCFIYQVYKLDFVYKLF